MQSSFRTWMLPEGVVEALPQEADKLNQLTEIALTTFSRWGYLPLRPPMMEYADTFVGGERSDNLAEQTIQFKDQKSGKQLGFRADMTPQIARIDAHYLPTKNVSRYAYAGEVVRSYPTGHNSARNPTIVGVELLGSASQNADIEIVSLLVSFLQPLDLPQLTIELGNIDIVIELLNDAGVDESQFNPFFEALAIKDKERLLTLAKRNHLSEKHRDLFVAMTTLYGDSDVLTQAQQLFADCPALLKESQRLADISNTLIQQHPSIHFHIDLADVHGYGYHNGLIFSAYVHGVWQAIARGGRYDRFGNDFSQDYRLRPSTGFSCELNLITPLVKIANKQGRIIEYSRKALNADTQTLSRYIAELREQGDTLIECFDDDIVPNTHCTHQLIRTDSHFDVIAKPV